MGVWNDTWDMEWHLGARNDILSIRMTAGAWRYVDYCANRPQSIFAAAGKCCGYSILDPAKLDRARAAGSVCTFTIAGAPDDMARSRAGLMSSGFSTDSPYPPSASAILSN